MRSKVIIGNWKMNKVASEAVKFIENVNDFAKKAKSYNVLLGIAPTFLSLEAVLKTPNDLLIAAQNCHFADSGAYTGEISATMLKDIGVKYCLIGHSERRQYFNETNETCNLKIKKLFSFDIIPVYCVGETLAQYEEGITKEVIKQQLDIGLKDITAENIEKLIIAYEPVWSIGTGKNASSAIAQDICSFIREQLALKFGKIIANKVIIQYGGSVKPENIKEYLTQNDIDGALVGGASLKEDSFIAMINNLL